ncbi:hypothetical protein LS482_14890 [Sinomicrobium kalidii]|uniref:hypothetical protein n=1 Tax=Sinomicrobium kalidii TaxID=2900738 RepID=UPI001E32C887|nr:hypothetical protein [Sinomicrobium kalidii]UGU14973.1 hypothetical protein LS482_14890 [Sinomicrobium kalidii]
MKSTFVLLLALCFVTVSNGQQSELTGPRVKNEKIWEKERKTIVVYHTPDRKPVTGPKAKNRKIWEKKDTTRQVVVRRKRNTVTGPRFKNRKPWKQ